MRWLTSSSMLSALRLMSTSSRQVGLRARTARHSTCA